MGEDHFRQIEHRGGATAILSVVQEASPFERERITGLMVGQNSEEIESLKEKLAEKNEEISRLNKAIIDLEDKNKKLDVALKTRVEEITKLKTRIGKLEAEKKGLEDKLRNVEGKLDRVEKEVEELEKANQAHDDDNVQLREKMEIMSGEMESVKKDLGLARNENQNLKREVKDLQDNQQKRFPFTLGTKEGRQMLAAPPSASPELQASLLLGELSRQLQAMMYAYVLPQLFTPIGNYKVKTIRRDVEKLPKTEEEKEKAKQKWAELQSKLNWNEMYEETMKQLQQNRNADAHPKITTQLLHDAVEVMEAKGNLKGWLSRDYVTVLINMWEQLSRCN